MKHIETFKIFETLGSYKIETIKKVISKLFEENGLKEKIGFGEAEYNYYSIISDRDYLKKSIEDYKDINHYMTKGMMKNGYSQDYLIRSAENRLSDFEYGDIYIFTNYNTPQLTRDLLKLINSNGYFVSKIRVGDDNDTKKEDIEKELSKKDKISISIEPVYDKQDIVESEYLYHTTDKNNLNKIMKIGLIPKTKNTRSFYPDRIYLSPNIKYLDSISDQLKGDKGGEFVKLKIKNFDGLKLYRDVRFKGGYYTYNNIHPKYIEVID